MAERVGFEPTIWENHIHDFQSCSFDHSDTAPHPVLIMVFFARADVVSDGCFGAQFAGARGIADREAAN